MVSYFRIRSWHKVDAERSDTLPAERSCESCLRILARQRDQ